MKDMDNPLRQEIADICSKMEAFEAEIKAAITAKEIDSLRVDIVNDKLSLLRDAISETGASMDKVLASLDSLKSEL